MHRTLTAALLLATALPLLPGQAAAQGDPWYSATSVMIPMCPSLPPASG